MRRFPICSVVGLSSIAVGILATVIGVPTLVSAEGVLSLYGGLAMPQPTTVTTTVNQSSGLFSSVHRFTGSRQADFSSSFIVGGRVGNWFERVPELGLAVDVSYFPTRASAVHIDVIPMSILAMYRVPLLTSAEYPMVTSLSFTPTCSGALRCHGSVPLELLVPNNMMLRLCSAK